MIDLQIALDFCKEMNTPSICICKKQIGVFKLGEYATCISSTFHQSKCYRGISPGKEEEYSYTTCSQIDDCFIMVYEDGSGPIYINLMDTVKSLFSTKVKKSRVRIPNLKNCTELIPLYSIFIKLPLLLIDSIDSDLLLPFSYLIWQVFDKINRFDLNYLNDRDEFIKLIYTCGEVIDNIKSNCLDLYLNGTEIDNGLIGASNEQARVLAEASELKVITSSFFEDFKTNFKK